MTCLQSDLPLVEPIFWTFKTEFVPRRNFPAFRGFTLSEAWARLTAGLPHH
jgi:hypothetical protein